MCSPPMARARSTKRSDSADHDVSPTPCPRARRRGHRCTAPCRAPGPCRLGAQRHLPSRWGGASDRRPAQPSASRRTRARDSGTSSATDCNNNNTQFLPHSACASHRAFVRVGTHMHATARAHLRSQGLRTFVRRGRRAHVPRTLPTSRSTRTHTLQLRVRPPHCVVGAVQQHLAYSTAMAHRQAAMGNA